MAVVAVVPVVLVELVSQTVGRGPLQVSRAQASPAAAAAEPVEITSVLAVGRVAQAAAGTVQALPSATASPVQQILAAAAERDTLKTM
jgi:hypothetical protein